MEFELLDWYFDEEGEDENTIDKWINYRDYHDETIINTKSRERIVYTNFQTELKKAIKIIEEREKVIRKIEELKKLESFDSCSEHYYLIAELAKIRNTLCKTLYSIVFSIPIDLQEQLLLLALKAIYKEHFRKLNEKKREDRIMQRISIIMQKVKEIQSMNPTIPIRITKSFIKRVFPELNSRQVDRLWQELQKNMPNFSQN